MQGRFVIPPPSFSFPSNSRQSNTNPFDIRESVNPHSNPQTTTPQRTDTNESQPTTIESSTSNEPIAPKKVAVEKGKGKEIEKSDKNTTERKSDYHQARENIKKLFENPPPVFSPERRDLNPTTTTPNTTPQVHPITSTIPSVSLQKVVDGAYEFSPMEVHPDRMSVSLLKGHHLSLNQQVPKLRSIVIGLGWDVARKHRKVFDLDASVFLLQENGKVREARDFIYYNNLQSSCHSVLHQGDNRTGIGDFDDETIVVNLTTLPKEIAKLIFVVSIHEAEKRKQNFGMVEHSFIRVVDLETNMEICRYDLKQEVSKYYAMIFGEVYQCINEWRFRAIGQGFDGGLKPMAEFFGVKLVDHDAQGRHRFW